MSGKALIELMQNRRTLLDDDNGVEESLNETLKITLENIFPLPFAF